jgi:hypothetical protein
MAYLLTMDEEQKNQQNIIEHNAQLEAMIDERPYQPITAMTSSTTQQISDNNPSKWRYFFIALGIVQAFCATVFFVLMLLLAQNTDSGFSGGEFGSIILFILVFPFIAVIALINLISLPIYLKKNKSSEDERTLSFVSLALSLFLVLYGIYNFAAPNI